MATKQNSNRIDVEIGDATFAPFDFAENRVQAGLSKLWANDLKSRDIIIEVMQVITESNRANFLLSRYSDAMEQASGDSAAEHKVLLAMLARFYIAGTLRGCRAIEA